MPTTEKIYKQKDSTGASTNYRSTKSSVHADLFGPMITADSNKKFVLCITNAFTKYAVVTAITNKDAELVADAINKEWFSKFGIPAQTHTDSSKEFVNKLSAELFQLLNVSHTKTSPAHPQCSAHVEVFNKMVNKVLQSFVEDTMLNWETFLLALGISYNTSYHSTIATTPFELLFRQKARLLSFPIEDIQQLHYSQKSTAEHFSFKSSELRRIDMQLKMVKNQKFILIKTQVPINFKSAIKCSFLMTFTQAKNPN
jgi:hypothetical protein